MKKNLEIEFELEEDYGDSPEADESEKMPDYEIGENLTLSDCNNITRKIFNSKKIKFAVKLRLIEINFNKKNQRIEITCKDNIEHLLNEELGKIFETIRKNFINSGKTLYIYQNF